MTETQPVPTGADAEPPGRNVSVEVANETQSPVDHVRLEAAVRAVLDDASGRRVSVSVVVVDDPTIHALNRKYLQHDYPTDVLSFALENDPTRLEGEIIVSSDTAERAAAQIGWSPADELLLYVVHGALHLAGYGDKAPEDAAKMHAAEAEVLDGLGVSRPAHDDRWPAVDDAQSILETQNT